MPLLTLLYAYTILPFFVEALCSSFIALLLLLRRLPTTLFSCRHRDFLRSIRHDLRLRFLRLLADDVFFHAIDAAFAAA